MRLHASNRWPLMLSRRRRSTAAEVEATASRWVIGAVSRMGLEARGTHPTAAALTSGSQVNIDDIATPTARYSLFREKHESLLANLDEICDKRYNAY